MGLLLSLLTLPLSAPINSMLWVADKLVEQAESQIYNPEAIYVQIMELEERFTMGELSEEQYMEQEEALLEQLQLIRTRLAQT